MAVGYGRRRARIRLPGGKRVDYRGHIGQPYERARKRGSAQEQKMKLESGLDGPKMQPRRCGKLMHRAIVAHVLQPQKVQT